MDIQRPSSEQPLPSHAQCVFKGILFDIYQWEQEQFDGTKKIFEKLKRPDTVVVFGVLPDGNILLTEQKQPGKIEPFIAAAGGRIDFGENSLEAAKRELLEETGYEASEYILWDARQPVTKIDWAVFTFIAKGLKKVKQQNLDSGEKIKLRSVSFDEFLEIGTSERFSEKEIVSQLFEARLFDEKKTALKKLFSL